MINISKHCHHLYEKTRKAKEHIDEEMRSINILKRKIKEIKNQINHIDTNRNHLTDKLNRLKQCSPPYHQSNKKLISNTSQIMFRRLSVLIDNVQKLCQKKLLKAERLLLLINQCHRLELEDEKLLLTSSKNDLIPQVHYLQNCHLEFDSVFDELSLFWKRYAHVQMDIYIRIQEKESLKKYQTFFKKQLKFFF
jgi:chromosome segregation ATPase